VKFGFAATEHSDLDIPADRESSVKIVILTGGTGSIALQRGLFNELEAHLDGIDTKIIVNAYDNGLSTGAVRKVMGGEILGPSDVRKNQLTRLQLKFPDSPWLKFLGSRFTMRTPEVRQFCSDQINQFVDNLDGKSVARDSRRILDNSIGSYFESPLALEIEYNDFSLANIIYAGLGRINGNSLRTAASIMANSMGIEDNVLLNDDKSLFLGAITQSGQRIADEGSIVSWDNEADPFIDIFFTDPLGREARPKLCLETWRALAEADLIILSSGTQWSSLIPTYASDGFQAAIADSNAEIVMVMNRTPDRDSPSQTASDIIGALVPRYFGAGRLRVLADQNGHPRMQGLDRAALSKVASFTRAELSRHSDPPDKHAQDKLVDAIGAVLFDDYLGSDFFLFDYDDTLVARGDKLPRSSRHNVKGISRLNWLTAVGICTGNTIRAVSLRGEPAATNEDSEPVYKPLLVFADGGVNRYSYDTRPSVAGDVAHPKLGNCISPDALLPEAGPHSAAAIIESLRSAGVPSAKIDNRGNALIAIKPVECGERRALISFIRHMVDGSNLHARECGRTTVEICRTTLSKSHTLKELRGGNPTMRTLTYIGDEFDSGNDRDIVEFATHGTGLRCLCVVDPAETGFFIRTLLLHLGKNGKH
jgi:2-phospho-L-lactate transferase/gluconeogenesis factor (CofD/UPF0052 family)